MKEGDDQTLAIISLVTAIVSLMTAPLMMSIIAMVCGRIQLKRIEAEPEVYGGKTLAQIGFWIGLIRGIMSLAMIVMVLVMYMFIFLMMGISIYAL